MKRRTIITSVLVIVLCLGLISGSTFALFTSESSVNIAVTSGKVKLTAELDDEPTLYSADATLTTGTLVDKIDPNDTTGTILPTDAQGTFAGTYYYKEYTNAFANGGTASVGTDGSMTIARMTPGDKVVAKLLVKNESNVAIKYRLKITATATDSTVLNSDKILDVLKVKFEGKLYNGLKEFSSAWIAKAAATTTETYESAVEIILPLDVAGDAYQDNDVKLTFTVEAVQGNAKTVDIVTAATTAVVTGATTKLVVPTSPLAEANTNTEVELTNVGTTNQTVKLTVETVEYDTSNSPTSYNVLSNDQAAVASVDLKLLVDDQAVTAFGSGASAKITTYVIKGLDDISVVYNGDSTKAFGNGGTRVTTGEAYVDEVGEYYYDAVTGKLVFVTDHFSEYVPATTDNLEAINTTTNTVYKSLVTAINNVTTNDEVLILKDVTYDRVTITKSMTLDGGNHTLTDNTAGRAIWIDDTGVTFTLKNLTIDGANICERGLQVNNPNPGIDKNIETIIMDNCVLKNLTAYAINFCSDTTVDMTIKNSSIQGWAALNAYGTGNTITAINSEFIGINDKGYNADGWNNFATICLEGDTTGQTEDHSADYTITFTNCSFKVSQTTGNKQSVLGYNKNAENSSVSFNNCKFDIGEGCYFYYNNGNTEYPNVLKIDGEVVSMTWGSYQNLSK